MRSTFERQRNTASVVLTRSVSANVTQSRPNAADNFSSCAPIAEGHFSARASSFENTWHADSERSRRQRETSRYFRTNKQERQLSKERTKRRTKNFIGCVKLQTAQKS